MDALIVLGGAFSLGLASSGHCLLMCGPIQSAWLQRGSTNFFIYHAGRTLSYMLIGLIVFSVGSYLGVSNFSVQSSLLLGVALVFGAILYIVIEYFLPASWTRPLLKLSAGVNILNGRTKMFALGAINGWLPCGMVWMAAAMAVPSENAFFVLGLMFAFSVGTFPVLLGVPVFQRILSWVNGQKISAKILSDKIRVKLIVPVIVMVIGVVLAARGLSFGGRLENEGHVHDPEAFCAPVNP
jgi:sulfite exporter TauE/SafE